MKVTDIWPNTPVPNGRDVSGRFAVPQRLGHNRPPEDISQDGRLELRERLKRDYAKVIERCRDLEVGLTQLPAEITTPAEAKRVTDFLAKQVAPFIRSVENTHKREKAPVLELVREYDDFFLRDLVKQLKKGVSVVQARMTFYQEKARAAARRAQEFEKQRALEAQRQAEELAAMHRQAAANLDGGRDAARAHLEEAAQQERAAEEARKVLEQPPDKGQIRGEYGGLSYLREEWQFECVDPWEFAQGLLDGEIPMRYLTVNEAAVREDIMDAVRQARGRNGPLPGIAIPGLRIFAAQKTVFKG